jgi:DNA polymerase III delta prime subunit
LLDIVHVDIFCGYNQDGHGLKVLGKYCATASLLLADGYYDGLLEAIEDCFQHQNTFMILDSPSGTGKTLVGIAVAKHFSGKERTKVIHITWPQAISAQEIYKELLTSNENEGLRPDTFFSNLFSTNFHDLAVKGDKSVRFNAIWALTLEHLFEPGFNASGFLNGQERLFLIIDEVPQDPYSAGLIGKLRDLLKGLTNVRLCLSGTNSKAANMVGQSQGVASSHTTTVVGSAWAVIITRLPRFDFQSCHVQSKWATVKSMEYSKLVVGCIESSIQNGGNSRSIILAIESAEAVISEGGAVIEEDFFEEWRKLFASKIVDSKFRHSSFSEASKGLAGQLNLLLDASTDPSVSDVLLSHHFAIRAIPDNGATISTRPHATFAETGGWLYLATDKQRGLGYSLVFLPGPHRDEPIHGTIFWQRTVFPRPESDCLLYLSAVRAKGYLSTNLIDYPACEVVLALWRGNAAGLVNHQKTSAILNTGSLMEVLLAAAIPNAAANSTAKECEAGFDAIPFTSYIRQFCRELGIRNHKRKQRPFRFFPKDVMLPRIIIPGRAILSMLSNTVGCLSRQPNKDGFDLLLQIPGTSGNVTKIRFEAKSREKLSTADTAIAAAKLIESDCDIGVLVLSNCCQFWGEKAHNKRKRKDLATCFSCLSPLVGAATLIDGDGAVEEISIQPDAGCVVIIKVPGAALYQH